MSNFIRFELKKVKSESSGTRLYLKNSQKNRELMWKREFLHRLSMKMQKVREHWEKEINVSEAKNTKVSY